MANDEEGWTHVKIRRRTHARLMAMVDEMNRLYEAGRIEAFWQGEGCTVGALLAYLMNRIVAHRQRAKKARAAAQRKRTDAILAATFVPAE